MNVSYASAAVRLACTPAELAALPPAQARSLRMALTLIEESQTLADVAGLASLRLTPLDASEPRLYRFGNSVAEIEIRPIDPQGRPLPTDNTKESLMSVSNVTILAARRSASAAATA